MNAADKKKAEDIQRVDELFQQLQPDLQMSTLARLNNLANAFRVGYACGKRDAETGAEKKVS